MLKHNAPSATQSRAVEDNLKARLDWFMTKTLARRGKEGFKAGMPGVRCGVDLPTCATGTQCVNGFCQNTGPPTLPRNVLPVYP